MSIVAPRARRVNVGEPFTVKVSADIAAEPITESELEAHAAEAAYSENFDADLAIAVARTFPAAIRCPWCSAPDGFLHADEDGIEFVCRTCFGFETTGPIAAALAKVGAA